jgi:hypothetical protein
MYLTKGDYRLLPLQSRFSLQRSKCKISRLGWTDFFLKAVADQHKSLRNYVAEFSQNMNAFLEKANDKEATNAFNSTSWESLQHEADQAMRALDAHSSRRRNWRNPFEAADNFGGYVARRMEFLLALMPSGEYTSILTGALRLAYNVSFQLITAV